MAGLKSYEILQAKPGVSPDQLLMHDLAGEVNTNFIYLFVDFFTGERYKFKIHVTAD